MILGSLVLYITPAIQDMTYGNSCRSKGGDWERTGQDMEYRCRIPAVDAGKVCSDGSECSYGICTGGTYGQPPPSAGNCIKYQEDSFVYKDNKEGIAPLVIFF